MISLRMRWFVGAAGFAWVTLGSRAARADPDMVVAMGSAVVSALNDLKFWSSVEVGLATAVTPKGRAAGPLLRSSINVLGIGIRTALHDEPVGNGHVGLANLAVEWRPLAFFRIPLYTHIDPFLAMGGELGGGSKFVAAAVASAGVSIAPYLNHEGVGPALVIEYDQRLARTPSEAYSGYFIVGTALRGTF